jgi:glucose-6-phosphate dehydrogenase assembly protein OpcA
MEETMSAQAHVSPDAILNQLTGLWRSLGKQGDGEHGAGVLRACTMTLVTLAEQDEDPNVLGETLAALMPEHPARAIVVRLAAKAGETAARVFEQCWLPFGQRRQICSEQVEITAPDQELGDLQPVVLPLAVADMPVVVWCRSPRLYGIREFSLFAGMATKVIVDGDALGRVPDAPPRSVLPGDLAWTRLTRWRETLARVFENRAYTAQLPRVRRVSVEFTGPKPPTSALYMGAWLEECLERAGTDATLEFRSTAGAAAQLERVSMSGEGLEVELGRSDHRLSVAVNGIRQCSNLPEATEASLMREELSILSKDTVFERVVASARRLAYSTDR